MLHLTAVAPKEQDNDHNNNNSPETGVFVIHSLTKTSSKNNYINSKMLLINTATKLIFLTSIISLLTTQQCLATSSTSTQTAQDEEATSTNAVDIFKPPPAPYECGSLDLRNNCERFTKLINCTVITGFLDIAQLPRVSTECNFSTYQFENLREITDFLIITEVRNLTSIKNMFPNLSVIRGRQLFLNYALVLTSIHDLEKLEFKSLIALQRGHVLIDANPKLCYTEKINWDRLTLRAGKNNILQDEIAQCPKQVKCNGCKRDSCWSNDVCQKIENDSVISLMQDTTECHKLCLGGCYNRTAQGCFVCKGYTDHGTCVEECPNDKYASRHYLRCYTREECIYNKRLYIYKNSCVDSCPNGHVLNNATQQCDSCSGLKDCVKTCNAKFMLDPIIYISNLMHAESLRGCQILNSSVLVNINEFLDEQDLKEILNDIKEIMGYLKINKSPYLTSLDFFQNLEKIHGNILDNKQYSLTIFSNDNLKEFWNVMSGFEILKGGMYIHGNGKLCNRRIREFREKVKHDNSLDAVQTSDQEVLCSPAKLNLYVQVVNHRALKFFWPIDQTSAQVEIIYKPLADKKQTAENSELDAEVCNRINWRRELKFFHELQGNSTHFIYIVKNLKPNTRYAGLVKTFNGEDDSHEARSEIKYATTQIDIPTSPKISLKSKTYDTLQIEFSSDASNSTAGTQVVDFYILQVFDMPDNKEVLDTRDYCEEPIMGYKDHKNEDYNDCCTRREKERKDLMFASQLRNDFSCSLDQPEYCKQNTQEFNDSNRRKAFLTKRFEAWENNYTIRSLKRFHLYALQVQACNHAGCSSFSMLNTRTNYSTAADQLYDFSVCKMAQTYDYKVVFSEPKLPNGYINAYALHFRKHNFSDTINNETMPEHHKLICITRLEHERNNYVYTANFNYTFNEAAIRVHSLGQHTLTGWFNITTCTTSKMAGTTTQGWNIFFVFFLIGAAATLLWVCYKRRYWHNIPQLRRFLPLHLGWSYLRPEPTNIEISPDFSGSDTEDRQILVHGFETVRFQNRPDEDMTHLVH